MFTQALTRLPGNDLGQGLTTAGMGVPDHALALRQHAAYVATLRDLGIEVEVLDALPGYPDAYFVEDPAVVLPQVAVITHPGALSRRGEVPTIAEALSAHRPTVSIRSPGTLEGGDVMCVEDQYYVGISDRTNLVGYDQFAGIVAEHGFGCTAVPLPRGLHLKTDMSYLGDGALLCTEPWADHPALSEYRRIVVPMEEAYAANALRINGAIVMAQGYPRTQAAIEAIGLPVIALDVSEPRKMDGGLSCMSLRF